jgi:hypothetical protein
MAPSLSRDFTGNGESRTGRLRPSPALQERIEELFARNREGGLSDEERGEWERYEYLEHLVRLAKARAAQRQSGREPS